MGMAVSPIGGAFVKSNIENISDNDLANNHDVEKVKHLGNNYLEGKQSYDQLSDKGLKCALVSERYISPPLDIDLGQKHSPISSAGSMIDNLSMPILWVLMLWGFLQFVRYGYF